jgi:hypothetical protein
MKSIFQKVMAILIFLFPCLISALTFYPIFFQPNAMVTKVSRLNLPSHFSSPLPRLHWLTIIVWKHSAPSCRLPRQTITCQRLPRFLARIGDSKCRFCVPECDLQLELRSEARRVVFVPFLVLQVSFPSSFPFNRFISLIIARANLRLISPFSGTPDVYRG